MQDPEEAEGAGGRRPGASSPDILVLSVEELQGEQVISDGMTTANHRYQVSMTKMQLIAESSRSEVKRYEGLSFGGKLQYTRQEKAAGLEGKDPLQEQEYDPWPWRKDPMKEDKEKEGGGIL